MRKVSVMACTWSRLLFLSYDDWAELTRVHPALMVSVKAAASKYDSTGEAKEEQPTPKCGPDKLLDSDDDEEEDAKSPSSHRHVDLSRFTKKLDSHIAKSNKEFERLHSDVQSTNVKLDAIMALLKQQAGSTISPHLGISNRTKVAPIAPITVASAHDARRSQDSQDSQDNGLSSF
jgi:hypothetical protein